MSTKGSGYVTWSLRGEEQCNNEYEHNKVEFDFNQLQSLKRTTNMADINNLLSYRLLQDSSRIAMAKDFSVEKYMEVWYH